MNMQLSPYTRSAMCVRVRACISYVKRQTYTPNRWILSHTTEWLAARFMHCVRVYSDGDVHYIGCLLPSLIRRHRALLPVPNTYTVYKLRNWYYSHAIQRPHGTHSVTEFSRNAGLNCFRTLVITTDSYWPFQIYRNKLSSPLVSKANCNSPPVHWFQRALFLLFNL